MRLKIDIIIFLLLIFLFPKTTIGSTLNDKEWLKKVIGINWYFMLPDEELMLMQQQLALNEDQMKSVRILIEDLINYEFADSPDTFVIDENRKRVPGIEVKIDAYAALSDHAKRFRKIFDGKEDSFIQWINDEKYLVEAIGGEIIEAMNKNKIAEPDEVVKRVLKKMESAKENDLDKKCIHRRALFLTYDKILNFGNGPERLKEMRSKKEKLSKEIKKTNQKKR